MPSHRLEALEATLSPGERARANRMDVEPRRRAVAARGLLRELLGLLPEEVHVHVGEHGKPYVDAALRFNVAHTGDLAVFAFAEGQEVGVDVERVRALEDAEAVATEVLTPPEREALASLPAPVRDAAFLEAWTRKEAYLKGRGDGLHVSPLAVVVSVLPHEPPALLSVRGEPGEPARWSLHRISPAPGHVGTLAIEAP